MYLTSGPEGQELGALGNKRWLRKFLLLNAQRTRGPQVQDSFPALLRSSSHMLLWITGSKRIEMDRCLHGLLLSDCGNRAFGRLQHLGWLIRKKRSEPPPPLLNSESLCQHTPDVTACSTRSPWSWDLPLASRHPLLCSYAKSKAGDTCQARITPGLPNPILDKVLSNYHNL
jgi:hypothetical protein